MQYDAVVFDNDGVLVEPTDWDVLRSAVREAFAELGVDDPADEHVEQLIGTTPEDVLEVAEYYGVDPHDLWYERDTAGSNRQSELIRNGGKPLFEDVAALEKLSGPLGIVSNNQHATVKTIVAEYGLRDHFEVVYGRQPTVEDLGRKKPDPYYLRKALGELDAEDALYVGDTQKDVTVAHRLGIDAALVRRSHNEILELDAVPEYEVPDLAVLVDQIG